ncbi:MAG: hypothetical protein L0Z50_25005 [Verrucomicrobiales bacterium]|nr:hypothetical protein [Verrucomicrobiales bacterium]
MPAHETSFKKLVDVPVHYDRLDPPDGYGSKGKSRTFKCTTKLKSTLEDCFEDLFQFWNREKPSIILTAGTIGDGGGAHGKGLAFDLDGFYWGDQKFMMLFYPTDRVFYLGINAHLFLYFSQVLSYHYPRHDDHFHVDFNFSFKFRPESNAQTFFLQACLKYLFGKDIGNTGIENDGVDGIFGHDTETAVNQVLTGLGITGGVTNAAGWKKFLLVCREKAFS